MKNFLEKHVKQYDIGIAVVMLLTFLCCMFQPMYAANRALTDQMWQQPEGTNAKIKIIKIDEKTLSELGQYNTWTREIPARLVEILSQDPENAPAVRKIRHMVIIFSSASPLAMTVIFSENESVRVCKNAVSRAAKKAIIAGIL